MIRIRHFRKDPGDGFYRHDKAWRVGTVRYHMSVPNPGSGIGPSIQVGCHVVVLIWPPRRRRAKP